MFYEASYAKKLLAGLSYQAFQADSILRQQLLRIKKKGQASLRFNCAFLLSNSVAEKTKQAMLSRRRRCCRRQLSQCARPQPSCCRRRHVTVSVNRTQLTEKWFFSHVCFRFYSREILYLRTLIGPITPAITTFLHYKMWSEPEWWDLLKFDS